MHGQLHVRNDIKYYTRKTITVKRNVTLVPVSLDAGHHTCVPRPAKPVQYIRHLSDQFLQTRLPSAEPVEILSLSPCLSPCLYRISERTKTIRVQSTMYKKHPNKTAEKDKFPTKSTHLFLSLPRRTHLHHLHLQLLSNVTVTI